MSDADEDSYTITNFFMFPVSVRVLYYIPGQEAITNGPAENWEEGWPRELGWEFVGDNASIARRTYESFPLYLQNQFEDEIEKVIRKGIDEEKADAKFF